MKILVTASTFPRWERDTEPRFVLELSRRLAKKFEVTVLCPGILTAKEYEEIDGLHIHRYKYFPYRFGSLAYDGGILPKLKKNKLYFFQIPFFLLAQLFAVRKILRKEKPSVIHAHWVIPQGFVAILYKKLFDPAIKVVVTVHGGDIYGLQNIIGERIKKFVLRNADEVTVVSNALKTEALKYHPSQKVHVYPMGVDTTLFSPEKRDDSLRARLGINGAFLLFVGRLVEKKGVRFLIEALPGVLKEFPHAKLVIVGGGPLHNELMHQIKKLGIEQSVVFTGPITHDDLSAYYATADIFIGPSIVEGGGDTEGFGLVFAEAMSAGTVVLATDLPSIADIVTDSQTGFIIKEKDAKDITKKILTLLRDQDKSALVKKNGREHVKRNFEWGIVSERYANLLTRLSH